jgi:selenocysteine lyase/cysteine desulfurase
MAHADFNRPMGAYFLSHSVGLLPKAAEAALDAEFLAPWRQGKADVWSAWLDAIDGFRASLAPLIGAEAADICPQTNISSALTKILFSLPQDPKRRKITLTEDDFPTIGFVAESARRAGYEPVYLKGGARLADPDAWAPAFAGDAAVVIATHVFSNTALKAPVAEIAARARASGVVSILDIAQSAGAVPVDLARWRPDFAIGTGVKYLCGGPGAAFLWADPAIAARCSPVDVGWFSHENPFEFDIRNFRFAEGAARFWGGTPSVAPCAIATAGFDAIARTGVEAIFAHNQHLIDRILAGVPATSILSHARAGERGSSLILRMRSAEAARAAFAEAGIACDERMGGFRFSVHLYNDEADAERLLRALEAVV